MDFSGFRARGADRWPYEQIADTIEKAIRSGELGPRDPVPSEQTIMDETGAARGTVRHAMALLREKGLIYTRPYLGSFTSPEIPPPP
jgi:DNA-binding GntR family transcriptional regulator